MDHTLYYITHTGESFILTRNTSFEREKARQLSVAPLPKIISQMNPWKDNGKALLKVLLELLALRICENLSDIQNYAEETLMYAEMISPDVMSAIANNNSNIDVICDLKSEIKELVSFLTLAKAIEYERSEKNKTSKRDNNIMFNI
jgi:hypothetical protein